MTGDARIEIPEIVTDRLLLRRMTHDDVADVFAYASDPEVARLTTWEAHRSLEDSREYLERVMTWYAEGFGGPWGLVLKDSGTLAGTCGLAVVPEHYRAEIGYAIGRRWWGQGLMTEAVCAAIRYGFDDLGLNRIEARCRPDNLASARVMQKCGMTYEGTLREHIFIKGRFETLLMYSVLRGDEGAGNSEGLGRGKVKDDNRRP